ncbi:hypothetical protein LINPERHAP1_LOCUS11777, partial [Linum perenne]
MEKDFKRFVEILDKVQFTMPFGEAITKMPQYAKFMKEIFTNKRKLTDVTSAKLNEQCSAILSKQPPEKLKDPGSFTIPCTIGEHAISRGLADLGASINVMPYCMFKKLGLGELKP